MKIVQTYYEEAYRVNPPMGFYTKGIHEKEEAVLALRSYIKNDSEDFLENYKESNGEHFAFDELNVKKVRYHTHRDCGIETIDGDGACCVCLDHNFISSGRVTFVYIL